MPLISMFPCSAGGASIDYNSRPQIDFDGKWIKWFVEFYDGEPYWEAQFFSSGTLTVTGTYTADAWGIGGGGIWSSGDGVTAGGSCAMQEGIAVQGRMAVTVGAGGRSADGGNTSFAGLTAGAGRPEVARTGTPYRFASPDKSNEAGANGQENKAQGGWLWWRNESNSSGYGYGAAGVNYYGNRGYGQSGALVIRIKI